MTAHSAELRAAVLARVEAGEPVTSVARAFGMSANNVYRWRDDARGPGDAPELPDDAGFDEDGLSAWERERAPSQLQELRASVRELLEALRDRGVGAVERRRRAHEDIVAALRGEQAEDDVVSNGISEDTKRRAAARVHAGETAKAVAADLGVALSTMCRWRDDYPPDEAGDDGEEDERQAEEPEEPTPLAWHLRETEAQRDAAERACASLRAELKELQAERDTFGREVAKLRGDLAHERQEHAATQALHEDMRRIVAELRVHQAQLVAERDAAREQREQARAGLEEATIGASSTAELEAEIVELKDDLIEAYREQRRLRRALEARRTP